METRKQQAEKAEIRKKAHEEMMEKRRSKNGMWDQSKNIPCLRSVFSVVDMVCLFLTVLAYCYW